MENIDDLFCLGGHDFFIWLLVVLGRHFEGISGVLKLVEGRALGDALRETREPPSLLS